MSGNLFAGMVASNAMLSEETITGHSGEGERELRGGARAGGPGRASRRASTGAPRQDPRGTPARSGGPRAGADAPAPPRRASRRAAAAGGLAVAQTRGPPRPQRARWWRAREGKGGRERSAAQAVTTGASAAPRGGRRREGGAATDRSVRPWCLLPDISAGPFTSAREPALTLRARPHVAAPRMAGQAPLAATTGACHDLPLRATD